MTTAMDWWALVANWLVFVLGCTAQLRAETSKVERDARDSLVLAFVIGGGVVLAGALLRAPPSLWWLALAPFAALMLLTGWTAVHETYSRRERLRSQLRSRPLTLRDRLLIGSLAASVAAVPTGFFVGVLAGGAETLRLAAAVGTLLSAVLWHLNWLLYRRWATGAKK